MEWKDEGYLLNKTNFTENSIKIDALTLEHGKYTGVVYGGSSKKLKKIFQIGNKILLNWKSKNENKSGYLNIELIKPVTPLFSTLSVNGVLLIRLDICNPVSLIVIKFLF